MRKISTLQIRDLVSELCIEANTRLRRDVLKALKDALKREKNKRAKKLLKVILENALIAKKERLAICQDTGLAVVFLELGRDTEVRGDLKSAVNKGVELGYKKGYLRNSVVPHPLLRGKPKYSPSVIHTDITKGSRLKITVLPKGFGCENKTQLKMFNPAVDIDKIKEFVIKAVKEAGPDACPPFVVGVGMGGTADYACLLAKKALLRKIGVTNRDLEVSRLEDELLKKINRLNIGPMGLGGETTALGVNIEIYPTHIAGLPVAVNISCHALRSRTGEL